jgi:hypothetical protein
MNYLDDKKMRDKIETAFHVAIPVLMVTWLIMLFADLAKHGH